MARSCLPEEHFPRFVGTIVVEQKTHGTILSINSLEFIWNWIVSQGFIL